MRMTTGIATLKTAFPGDVDRWATDILQDSLQPSEQCRLAIRHPYDSPLAVPMAVVFPWLS
jgi:hypothetical protein